MKKIMLYSVAFSALLLGACSHNQNYGKGLERWTTFDGKTIATPKMEKNQATVYFYRDKDVEFEKVVNVFVGGDYLTSVREGGYRAAVLCAIDGDRIFPSFSRRDHFSQRSQGVRYKFESNKVSFVKVVFENNQPVFKMVSPEEGKKAISQLRQETQTLPRVKQNRACPAKKDLLVEKITLEAGSLFKFDKSDYKNMLPEGKAEINKLAKTIKEYKLNIRSIDVSGYTDPMGTEHYNQALSERRAETVKNALIQAGVKAPIYAEGYGEANLIVPNCLSRFSTNVKARKECDQVNRRVEIAIYGEEI